MSNLAALHAFVESKGIKQHGLQSGTFGSNYIDAINIANIEYLVRLDAQLPHSKGKNLRIGFFGTDIMRINDNVEKLRNTTVLENRLDSAIRVRDHSECHTM